MWSPRNQTLYAVRNKKDFKERLNAGVERNVLSSVGRRFHACGAATENALSPSLRRVLSMTKFPFIASRSADRDGTSATAVRRFFKYTGAWPSIDLWTSRHSLYSIRWAIGSQWSSLTTFTYLNIIPGVWSNSTFTCLNSILRVPEQWFVHIPQQYPRCTGAMVRSHTWTVSQNWYCK